MFLPADIELSKNGDKMKKYLGILLLIVMVFTCGCSSASVVSAVTEKVEDISGKDDEVLGADWRTYKAYGLVQRNVNGNEEYVYVEAFTDSGEVRLIKDEAAFNILQTIKVMHDRIYDREYIENNVTFSDYNDDGIEDLVLTDLNGDSFIAEVYIYDPARQEFVFSELDSANLTSQKNGKDMAASDQSAFLEEIEAVLETEAAANPDNGYFLFDVNGDGDMDVFTQTGEEKVFELYYPLYDGDLVVGAMSAGVIPGSEQSIFACDDNGALIMNRFVQGARYVYTVSLSECEVVTEEIYSAEEEEYGFDGTEIPLWAVTDTTPLYE